VSARRVDSSHFGPATDNLIRETTPALTRRRIHVPGTLRYFATISTFRVLACASAVLGM